MTNDNDERSKSKKTSTGLAENIGGLLAYLLGFVTGIVLFIIEKDNEFIRFHSLQSIFTFGSLFIINWIFTYVPFIGWVVNLLFGPVTLILWILLMYKAYNNEKYKLPVVGELVEKQLQK